MTVELWLFGVQVMCFTIGASDVGAEPDGYELAGGSTTSYPVGFTIDYPPEEVSAPQHCPSWDEPEDQQ